MATVNVALVRMTIPALDPLMDAVTCELVYQQDGGDPSILVANCPGLFNVVGSGASLPIASYLHPALDGGTNHCTIKVYDITSHLDGSNIGAPVASGSWTLAAPSGEAMPEGLAAVVSYRADYGTDVEFSGPRAEGAGGTRPRSRDRNRHYFGPLNTRGFVQPSTANRVTFSASMINDLLADTKQVEVIVDTGFGGVPGLPDQWNLQVWSRKGAAVKPVAEYWMDDRPDYQRRRSDAPGQKTFLAA